MSLGTDQTYLLNEQYKDASNLEARMALHWRFNESKESWQEWVFDQLNLAEGSAVLEVGCGPAKLWEENKTRIPSSWHLTLMDLSAGMIAEAQKNLQRLPNQIEFKVADVQALPFADNSFDLVVANHMLYHVPDLNKGLSEIKRVLKPGGRLIAATNGSNHMRELDELSNRLAAEEDKVKSVAASLSFRLETGRTILEQFFDKVELRSRQNNLRVTEVEPLVAYVLSEIRVSKKLQEFESEAEWNAAINKLRQEIAAEMAANNGEIKITRATGLFVAYK